MTKKSKEDKKAVEALKKKEEALTAEALREEREKLIIKYLGMSYSFDVASQLADEELGLKND